MLGEKILDLEKVESFNRTSLGLGLLPAVTEFRREKKTCRVQAVHLQSGQAVQGYEIHMGLTKLHGKAKAMFHITERNGASLRKTLEGASAQRGESLISGTYLHGVLNNAPFLHCFLNDLRIRRGLLSVTDAEPVQDRDVYDCLAQKVQTSIDVDFLRQMADI